MKGSLRAVATALLGALLVTAGWLTFVTVDAGSRYRSDPRNVRSVVADYLPDRGRIVTADGEVVAEDGPDGRRRYPHGVLYAHVTGYDTPLARSGVEESRYADLRIRDDHSITDFLLDLGSTGRRPNDVVLTIDHDLQQAARDAIEGKTGAILLIDVRTGAVLAAVSSPAFDPNRVAAGSLDPEDLGDAAIDRTADRVLPPGSVFKLIVSAAAIAAGDDPDTEYENAAEYLAPGAGSPIGNAGDGTCGSGDTLTLTEALVVSCNVVFARLAVELGGQVIASAAEEMGLNAEIPWESNAVLSSIPDGDALAADLGALAQTGIGERDLRVTPLAMLMVVSAIANDGVAMTPRLVEEVSSSDGATVRREGPTVWRRMLPTRIAADLRTMMRQVVERGTGVNAAVDGLTVGGKTGTAEGSGGPHAWFVGFAPVEDPQVAIVVLVEGGGSGGRVAAPMARAVLGAWLNNE